MTAVLRLLQKLSERKKTLQVEYECETRIRRGSSNCHPSHTLAGSDTVARPSAGVYAQYSVHRGVNQALQWHLLAVRLSWRATYGVESQNMDQGVPARLSVQRSPIPLRIFEPCASDFWLAIPLWETPVAQFRLEKSVRD